MITRKSNTTSAWPPSGWELTDEITVNGRRVTPGTELTVRGIRGRASFIRHVRTATAEWVDVSTARGPRAIHPVNIKTVHHRRTA